MSIPTKALQHIISIEWGSITISKLAKTDQSLAKKKKKKEGSVLSPVSKCQQIVK